MGQSASVKINNDQQNALIQEINLTARELSNEYSTHFLDPDFCNRLALVYTDKLVRYQKQVVDGVAYNLGIVQDVPLVKERACEAIVKHYTDRLNLIGMIQASLSYVSDRILALTTGPRCEGNPEVFDQNECEKSGGHWTATIIMPDANLEENQQWYSLLNRLQNSYLRDLQRLLSILNQLKRFDHDVNDERLKQMNTEAKGTIDNLHRQANELYKMVLTTPTRTREDVKLQKEQDAIKAQEESARLAALRSANGLPPTKK